jgi:hypothetical protein
MSAGIKGAWREGPCCQEIMPFACPVANPCTLTYALDSQEDGSSGSDPYAWVSNRSYRQGFYDRDGMTVCTSVQ